MYCFFEQKYFIRLILLLSLGITGCGSDSTTPSPEPAPKYEYQQPIVKNDGWLTAHLDELSIDTSAYEALVDKIVNKKSGYRHIDSVMVIKGGKIIFDESFRDSLDMADGWANNQDINLHILNSVTKSFTSSLIGIAIEQGYIEDVNVKVHDYFQAKLPVENWSTAKENVTLKNWLTMRHGYLWDEWNVSYLESENINSQMNNSKDPITFLLSRPMETEPGSTFAYSTGVSFAIGRLLENATGQSVTDFMEQNLFAPLGIEQYTYWALDGQLHTGSSLYLSPRDMAKFGQLFLNKGEWNGEQVVSESWVTESTSRYHDKGSWGYGYQWWSKSFIVEGRSIDSFSANGFGGQFIYVLPEIDTVVVFTGKGYQVGEMEEYRVEDIMENDILPSLLVDE